MERRTLVGGILIWSGLIFGSAPASMRGQRNNESNEEAMWRLQNAREFFPAANTVGPADLLYRLGIVSQLALTSCLVAVGWSDDDCRRHVGQDVGKAFRLAQAKGLQFRSENFRRLTPLLSQYGRWRSPSAADSSELAPLDENEARAILANLLASVRSHLIGGGAEVARR